MTVRSKGSWTFFPGPAQHSQGGHPRRRIECHVRGLLVFWSITAHTVPKIQFMYSQKGIVRPQSQFLHCICARFIYASKIDRPIPEIYKSLTDI